MERRNSSEGEGGVVMVVAIECVGGGSKAEEWGLGGGEMLRTGDVVEEIKIGGSPAVRAPFKGGRAAVQKLLHAAFKRGHTSINVRVRRALDRTDCAELQACIVPHDPAAKRGHYVLRSIHDPNYTVRFVDRLETDCIALQGSRSSRVVCALSRAQLHDGYVAYPWERKMRETLMSATPSSSGFLSLLILPRALDPAASRYSSLDDTLARADAWLLSAQASGVPIVFTNVQTEALLTKISGETASATVNSGSLDDLSNLANASLYGFEDYHARRRHRSREGRSALVHPCRRRTGGGDSASERRHQAGLRHRPHRRGFYLHIFGDRRRPRQRGSLDAIGAQRSLQRSEARVEGPGDLAGVGREGACSPGWCRRREPSAASTPSPSARSSRCTATPCARSSSTSSCGKSPSSACRVVARALGLAVLQPPQSELPLSLVPTPEPADDTPLRGLLDTTGDASFRFHDSFPPNNWV